jgi:tetratricopeptide (TPR) repeat protein
MSLSGIRIVIFLVIFLLPLFSNAQQRSDIGSFKRTAISHMQAGRYGEAIDQLNKYIAANPQESEGYNLRAICWEKRQQYAEARLDYRRAFALETRDANKHSEYGNNLQHLISIWYPLLNKNITGYQREIAINANTASNYLEIGKAYKLMEIWDKAEQWYDEYLKRDDNASPDEIIRYTEVLAKTGSIVKGEKILKKFVERYPQDWRLWSRYGYFTLWLAKYQIAKHAFETALGFKPFFKEAQDGLDIVNQQAYMTLENPRAFEKEYPIDRYYKILKRKPNDVETRFKLIDELIAANRNEEAYQQLKIIGNTNPDDARYKEKYDSVSTRRSRNFQDKLILAKAKLLLDPDDKESMKIVAENYENLQYYDSAAVMLDKYFEKYPDEKDSDLRFRWARNSAWDREFDKAIDITDKLLEDYPDNLDYQLFRAQVSIWITRDIEKARGYLDNVLKARPNSIDALISMGSLSLIDKDYDKAQEYENKAKEIDPSNDEVIKLQSNIDWQKMRAEEEKVYAILEAGRQKVMAQECSDALPFYEEYLAKAEPNVLIQKEYGDVLFCAKDYTKAMQVYNDVLSKGPNFEAQMQRAKLYYVIGDSVNSLREFKDLAKQDSSSFDAHIYLGDSYTKMAEPDSAREVYDSMLERNHLDSTQVQMVNQRRGWLPVTGLAAIVETFPNYVGLAPIFSTYNDNLSFKITQLGSRLELGLTNFLSFGITFMKSWLSADPAALDQDIISTFYDYTGSLQFTTFKGNVSIRFSKYMNLGVGFGNSNAQGAFRRDESDLTFHYERKDTVGVNFIYQSSDAALILYSPYLIDVRYYARLYKMDGYYQHRDGLKISGYFQYVSADDGNEGNDFNIRLGKYFEKNFIVGYEYAYINYKFKSQYYYSPRNFESHSLWLDQILEKHDNLRVSIGGKIGYIPQSSLMALEAHIEAFDQVLKNISVSGKLSVGSTSRDQSSYRYFSAQLTAYWNIF